MRYRITNARTGGLVSDDAVLATSAVGRMKGLLGRKSMEPGEAIILRPASSIHTLFMRFPLDVIYLDSEHKVLKVVSNLVPFRFSATSRAQSVVEMASGSTRDLDLRVGDPLLLELIHPTMP